MLFRALLEQLRRARLPLALIVALVMAFAQQTAVVHMASHGLGQTFTISESQVSTVEQDDSDHHAALSLAHSCSTCIAIAGIAAGASSAEWQAPVVVSANIAPAVIATSVASAQPIFARVRGPPAVL